MPQPINRQKKIKIALTTLYKHTYYNITVHSDLNPPPSPPPPPQSSACCLPSLYLLPGKKSNQITTHTLKANNNGEESPQALN